MTESTRRVVDLTRDLAAVRRMGTSPEQVDDLLGASLEALGNLIPFDLGTIMELEGDDLRVRVARGPLDDTTIRGHVLRLADFPSIAQVLEQGHARAFLEHDHAHGDGDPFDGVLDLPHGHACMVVPLAGGDVQVGVMTLDRQVCATYPQDVVELANVVGQLIGMAMVYGEQSARLARVSEELEERNRALREKLPTSRDAGGLIEACSSPAMRHLTHLARQVAATDTPVLISGETGSGKEVLATAIHEWSGRAERPLVTINCAALPAALIESELFGHVRGAFTGATRSRPGRFQAANGGTLFLDEIGELPLELQAKLLRVLQEGTFEPVGSDRTVRVDVRVIAATNVDLQAACEERTFREDLYYRLAVFPLRVPPLRARAEDLPVIANNFLASLARRTGRGPWTLSSSDETWLRAQPWRGNVRELVNALERATIIGRPPHLALGGAVPPVETAQATARTLAAAAPEAPLPTLAAAERALIRDALARSHGRVWGEGGAAEMLGVNPSTLSSRMRKHGLGGARAFRRDRGA